MLVVDYCKYISGSIHMHLIMHPTQTSHKLIAYISRHVAISVGCILYIM